MKTTAEIVRWLARIVSGLILVFVAFYVAAYFLGGEERSARPLTTKDYAAITLGVVLLTGLAAAWKWEALGALVTLVTYLILGIGNPRVLAFPGILIPITALLFLASWWMRRSLRSAPASTESTG